MALKRLVKPKRKINQINNQANKRKIIKNEEEKKRKKIEIKGRGAGSLGNKN